MKSCYFPHDREYVLSWKVLLYFSFQYFIDYYLRTKHLNVTHSVDFLCLLIHHFNAFLKDFNWSILIHTKQKLVFKVTHTYIILWSFLIASFAISVLSALGIVSKKRILPCHPNIPLILGSVQCPQILDSKESITEFFSNLNICTFL